MMPTMIRACPDLVLLPNQLTPYRFTSIEPVVPLPAFDPHASPLEIVARNILLREWINRLDYADAWHRQQQALVQRMLLAWNPDDGKAVLYYSKAGQILGLGPDCPLGTVPQILVRAEEFLKG